MSTKSYSHIPGPLKQRNKQHKSGSHKSKRFITQNYTDNVVTKRKQIYCKSKKERNHDKKRRLIENKKQLKENLADVGFLDAHIPISIISLVSDFTIQNIIDCYSNDANFTVERDWMNTFCRDFYRVESSDKKQKLLFLDLTQDSAFYVHDSIISSQAVWVLSSDSSPINREIFPVIDTLEGITLPPIYHIVKFKHQDKKSVSDFINDYGSDFGQFIPDRDKILEINDNVDTWKLSKCIPHFYLSHNNFVRGSNQKKNVTVLSEGLHYDPKTSTLAVDGFIRGGELSANHMIALPGFGHYKISQIDSVKINRTSKSIDVSVLCRPTQDFDEKRFLVPDLEMEDDEEDPIDAIFMKSCDDTNEEVIKQLPKMEIDEEFYSCDASEDSDVNSFSETETLPFQETQLDEKFSYFSSIDDFIQFGYLCDNPYNREIIQFDKFEGIKNKVIKTKLEESVKAGEFVRVHVSDVSKDAFDYFSKIIGRLIIHRLYPLEDKLSVMHYFIHKKDYTPDLFSNNKYLLFCGPRRFRASCIFSKPSNYSKRCHKVLPMVQGEAKLMVTVVSYVTFPPAPVTLFIEADDGELTYVGNGHVLKPSSSKLLVNELVLAGTIRKAFKKSIVVTGMFENRDEVEKFMKVELYTSHGDKGHIIKPIGTHGTFKCHFTLPTIKKQQIFARLYKPVYPVCDIETQVYC